MFIEWLAKRFTPQQLIYVVEEVDRLKDIRDGIHVPNGLLRFVAEGVIRILDKRISDLEVLQRLGVVFYGETKFC